MTLALEPSVIAALALLGVSTWLALCSEFLGRARPGAAGCALGSDGLAAAPLQLGEYELMGSLGQGAMGQVYRARHRQSGAWRALKALPRGASARARQRFASEAALGASLRHDGIVAVYEHGEAPDGSAFYAMELIEGESLQWLVEQRGALAPERAIELALALCDALEHLHAQGLVHRDVKPDNVLVYRTADGAERVKLVDLGLVRRAGEAGARASVVGTPLYMSPEAITAPELAGARSDLYALGALLYFMLSGAPVFHGQSAVEVCCQHLYSEPAPLSETAAAAIPAELERTVQACLAKDPAARPGSARELAERLARCASGAQSEARGARIARLVPKRVGSECAAAA